jgi:arylsulfatase A-like enzyme/Flp pilus assembly protein TadD
MGKRMNKKLNWKIFFFCINLIGALILQSFAFDADTKKKDWNVLLISIDTLRPDRLSCYSSEYLQTPHIDAMASKGVLFERAFAHTPTTLASHVNIMLGTTPLHHGIHENTKFSLSGDFFTLAEYLKQNGYSTGAFIGAFPLDSRFGLSQGFDVYDESYPSKASSTFVFPERKADQVIRAALDWLEKQNSKWFSFIHIWDPHAPYLSPEPFNEKFKDDPYSGEVAYVDSELRKLFDYLEDSGLLENTLLVFTGDHGESLGEHGETTHGYFAYNSTLWVPLILAGPGIKPARIDKYVGHIDIFPTICDFLRMEKPASLQGNSLLPLIEGKKWEEKAIYIESLVAYYNRGWAPLRGYIEGKGKFIDSPLPEYYNLEEDFHEQNNCVLNRDVEKHQKKMAELVDRWTSPEKIPNPQRLDRETREKLRSLGYISSPATELKESYGPEDDLKTLLPFHQKHSSAIIMFGNNRIPESVKLLNDIIQERKDFAAAYIDLANIYELQGLIEDALTVMETGYKNNPEKYRIISNYGFLLVKQGRLDKGIEFLQKALGIMDNDPEVWTHLGIAFTEKGEFQKALEHYGKALSLDGTNALIYNNLGFLHFTRFIKTKMREDHARAVETFQRAVELDPQLASAYNGLGGAYKISGQLDEAIAAWEKSLELNPDYDFPIYNLGVTHLQKGNKKRALEYFEKYLMLKSQNLSPEELRKIESFIQECKK